MAGMDRLQNLEDTYIDYYRGDTIVFLRPSALVECQVRQLIYDVKELVAKLPNMASMDVEAKPQLIADKTDEELRAQIMNLEDELRLERYAHERTKQSVGEFKL
jgi:hypothetical protein